VNTLRDRAAVARRREAGAIHPFARKASTSHMKSMGRPEAATADDAVGASSWHPARPAAMTRAVSAPAPAPHGITFGEPCFVPVHWTA
jgi:hypothetical protein